MTTENLRLALRETNNRLARLRRAARVIESGELDEQIEDVLNEQRRISFELGSRSTLSQEDRLTLNRIAEMTAKEWDIDTYQLYAKNRSQPTADARHVAFFLAWLRGYRLTEIAWHFGKRDHTTVIHGRDKVQNLMETQPEFSERVTRLVSMTQVLAA